MPYKHKCRLSGYSDEENLELLNYAVIHNYDVIPDEKDPAFVGRFQRYNVHIWYAYGKDAWVAADLELEGKDFYYRNHRYYDTLKEVLETEAR